MSVGTKAIEKILKSKETEEQKPKPKPKHEPLHPESRTLSLGSTVFVRSTAAYFLKRSKSTSELAQADLKTESETECHGILDKWCIYRVPSKLRNVNEAAYTPQLLSIGLFHYGKPELKGMEDHKEAYFQNFCARTWERKGEITPARKKVELRQFIKGCKEDIIRCYAGTIELTIKDRIDHLDIILVDACFIIELFLMNFKIENHEKDYILSSPWLRKAVELELILFENQLPYSLLRDLFDYAFPVASSSSHPRKECSTEDLAIEIDEAKPAVHHFLELTCQFFKDYSMGKSAKDVTVKPKHFTDLVRHFRCPDGEMKWAGDSVTTPIKSRYNIRKLTAAGVNFKLGSERAGFVVKSDSGSPNSKSTSRFRNMSLELTKFYIKDDTECIIRNVMALEQFVYPNEAYVCNYFLLMDKLVDTLEDVDFLVGKKVIVNMLGCNQAAVKLVNNLCDHIMEEKSCYTEICKELNDHYENSWNRHVVSLKRVYFKDIWTGSSTVLGLVVLAFSIIGSIQSFKK